MIKLYGSSMSRAGRSLWALEETGVKFEQVLVGETRKPEYLKVNPNGHVPTLDDNGTILWESMAINLYVAEKCGKAPLWPSTVEGHGACYQWSLWGMTEVETRLIEIFEHRIMLPAAQRDEKVALAAVEKLKAPLKVLDDHLRKSEYLLGKEFTIADLNVASVMSIARYIQLDLSSVPTAEKWLQKCLGRPANQRAGAMK
ncbi:MAG TPA: glutathione S-transferase family protein [Candidatus Binatus sp.]|uniref:glutathione S-transferase family protein n=1 Tax=Candidatus Binatus sp. TaxID=2811406 RepID=UPI002B498AF2|nr:glutathione S-transferase family protein [Candidatus Binatus sp.]HKN12429.1 glutathione S-transferase family protein [Candidatus Binatus sp.]